MSDLFGLKILIVEDEYILATDLARNLEQAGDDVLEPVTSVAGAMRTLADADKVEAAILDIDLRGEPVFPLADELVRRRVPFLFYTGYDDILIPKRFRQTPRVAKPANWRDIRRLLFRAHNAALGERSVSGEITALLPRLRLLARIITSSPEAADHLVEHTLERAIDDMDSLPIGDALEQWMFELLVNTRRVERSKISH